MEMFPDIYTVRDISSYVLCMGIPLHVHTSCGEIFPDVSVRVYPPVYPVRGTA
jgi:hypothetical protein